MKLAADDPHTARIEWPTILPEPISEYSDKKIFVMAFPWLYPGGKFASDLFCNMVCHVLGHIKCA